eukprot:CAMPEP_0119527822 /NCGR_PEP_ID=MMETSP1344-20130328/42148_1 /TAXON_ID=236787 /ORGANISM="Florenciella parvula, Strain CCMP2471" /LENGTH=238 /DNA_ID=CAMNT_0007567079 /DNA_START=5 /DNA_END=718 /DNA_ORIENTATION=+
MTFYASLMVIVYPIGIPALYIVLLFKARKELAIPELQLSEATRSKSFMKTFFGYHARTSKEHTEADARWEKLREEHYLNFLIQPYEQRVYWFEVMRRLFLSGVLILFGAGTVTQVVAACGICLFTIKTFLYYAAFDDPDDDFIAEVAQYQLFGILWIGLLLRFNNLIIEEGGDSLIPDERALGLFLTFIVFLGPGLVVLLALRADFVARNPSADDEAHVAQMGGTSAFTSENPLHDDP